MTKPDNTDLEEEALAWLARLRAGDLGDQAEFERWYASDVAHADAYDRVLRSWEKTSRTAETSLGRARTSTVQAPRRQRRLLVFAAAAVALALVGFALSARVPALLGASAAYAYETKRGEIRLIRLPDGSRITLDTDSAAMSVGMRAVRLSRGRARFDVAGQAQRPFVIDTGAGSVVIAAGSLDVTTDHDHAIIDVRRGVAQLPAAKTDWLAAGRSVRVDGTGQDAVVTPTPASDPRWVNGMLAFENTPLADVITAANRYARSPIALADPAIGGERFTGTFVAADTRSLVNMLATMFGLTVESRGGSMVLSRPKRENAKSY